MRRLTALLAAGLVVSVVAASCGRAEARREPADSPRAASSSDATTSPQADRRLSSPLPEPDAWIPRAPDRLAPALDATTRSLRSAIDRWTTEGDDSSGEAPLDVQLLALYQQRIYRMLARDPALADDLYAGTESGPLFRSSDEGATWQSLPIGGAGMAWAIYLGFAALLGLNLTIAIG